MCCTNLQCRHADRIHSCHDILLSEDVHSSAASESEPAVVPDGRVLSRLPSVTPHRSMTTSGEIGELCQPRNDLWGICTMTQYFGDYDDDEEGKKRYTVNGFYDGILPSHLHVLTQFQSECHWIQILQIFSWSICEEMADGVRLNILERQKDSVVSHLGYATSATCR